MSRNCGFLISTFRPVGVFFGQVFFRTFDGNFTTIKSSLDRIIKRFTDHKCIGTSLEQSKMFHHTLDLESRRVLYYHTQKTQKCLTGEQVKRAKRIYINPFSSFSPLFFTILLFGQMLGKKLGKNLFSRRLDCNFCYSGFVQKKSQEVGWFTWKKCTKKFIKQKMTKESTK